MNEEQKEFLWELKKSRVNLCKRAACSLDVAWSDLEQANKRIAELQEELQQMNDAAKDLYGAIDEYQAMPCESLLRRMVDTAKLYKETIFDNIIWMGLRHK